MAPERRRRATRLFQVAAILVATAIAVAIVIHTAPVRRAVLRRALATVQERLKIDLRAERLDYNLLALRVTLTGVSAAAPGHATPFFMARRVLISVPTSAVLGPFSLDEVTIDDARVHVVRRADGTTNLPEGGSDTGEEPAPLPVSRIDVPRIAIEIEDAPSGVTVAAPALEVVLEREDGHVRLLSPARVTRGTHATRITELAGPASFDGRVLTLGDLRLETEELALSAKGTIALLVRDPNVDLHVEGRGDSARLARWALETGDSGFGTRDSAPGSKTPYESRAPNPESRVPRGEIVFKSRASGELSNPVVTATLTSPRLQWREVAITDVGADVQLASDRLHITRAQFDLAGGRISANGEVTIGGEGETRMTASWTDVDTEALVRAFALDLPVRPTGRIAGTLSVRGPGFDTDRWVIDARNRMRAGQTTRGRLGTSGALSLRLAGGTWRLDADHVVAGALLRADLHGSINSRRLAASTLRGEARLTSSDVPALLRALRTAGVVEVEELLTRGAVRADARLAGSVGSPSFDFDLEARDVEVRGVNAPLVNASGTVDAATKGYRLTLDARDASIIPTDEMPLAATAELHFEGAGTVDGPAGRGSLALHDARYDRIGIGTVTAEVDLEPRGAQVRASIPDFNARAEAHVSMAAPHDARLLLAVERADLARLVRDLGLPAPLAGTVSLTGHANGPLDDRQRIRALVDVRELEAKTGDLPLRLLSPGRLTYAADVVSVETFEAVAGKTRISVAGQVPLSGGETRDSGLGTRDSTESRIPNPGSQIAEANALRATVTGNLGEAVSALAATGLVAMPPVTGEGPLALLARVSGSVDAPRVSADLELGPGSVALQDLPPFTGVHIRAHLEDDWIELRQAEASWQGAQLTATGRAPVRASAADRPYSVIARATGITPAVLQPFLDADTLSQLEGSVDASLQLQSPSIELTDVRGELRLDRLDLRIANLPIVQRQPTRIVAEQGFARIAAWQWAGQGATLDVQGQVRLSDRQAAILANGQIDLRTLTPFVRDVGVTTAGRLEPRLSITGTLDDPRIDGDATLAAGEVRVVDPRVVISDLAGRILLSQTRAQIATVTGSVNGGALTVTGEGAYGPGSPATARLASNARGVAMEFPAGLRSELDASLTLDVTAGDEVEPPSGTLTGTVTVLRGAYREPLAVATGLLAALRADRLAPAPSEESLLNRLALDVRVLTDEDVIVDNNVGQLALATDLRVIGTAAQPSLAGRATVREGSQLFLGRNIYTVETGTIDFANPITIEPDLNIVAHTRAGGEEIELAMKGTPETLEVELRSITTPELGQADVASLLLTGRRLDEVTGDEAQIVGEQVLGYLSGDVLGLASRAVGLDMIRLGGVEQTSLRGDPISIATETDPTARLTFGKSIGRNLDVTFSQSLRDGDAQTWIVEYLPRRQLELRLVSQDDDLRSYGFRHDVSFGAGPTATPARVEPRRREARVSSVSFRGTLVVPEGRLRGLLALEPGDRFDFSEWQRDRDRLERFYQELGRYEARMTAHREEKESDVTLSYQIDAGPPTRITIAGHELDATTRARLENAWAQSVFDDFLVDEVQDVVREALAREGYMRAVVKASLRQEADGAKTVAIEVEPGPRSTDRQVELDVDDSVLEREVRAWASRRGLLDRAWSDPSAAARELTAHLRSRGYLQARVTVGAPIFEGTLAALPITIVAGPVFTIARVEFENASGVSTDSLREAVGLAPSTIFDPAAVDAARARLSVLYRREGFSSARVAARQAVDNEAHQVAVTFAIDEGPRQVLSEVNVEGNRSIDPDVITRSMELPTGQPIGAEAWLRARKRLFDTGLFRRVDVAAEPVGAADDGVQPMRARVTVQEWPALRLRYGFEISEERPEDKVEGRDLVPGLSADLTRRTLFGRALTLVGTLQYQRRERLARGSLSAPTLLGLPIESSLTLARSREEFAAVTLITDKQGVSWEQRLRFARNLALSYVYRFERNHTFDTDPDPDFPFDLTINIARLIGTAAWDTRDDPADATRGGLLSSSLEYAPEPLGSDIRFVRYLAQAYYFRPIGRLVLASAGRVGLVTPLGGQDLILSERFFAGGARTVRGAQEDGLGPRDFFGDPTGGEALLVLNQEARVPLYRWLRGVAFIDVGNVFEKRSAIRFGDLEGAMGFGFRLQTPFALLRVDYGKLFSPEPGQRSGRWYFGIGQAF